MDKRRKRSVRQSQPPKCRKPAVEETDEVPSATKQASEHPRRLKPDSKRKRLPPPVYLWCVLPQLRDDQFELLEEHLCTFVRHGFLDGWNAAMKHAEESHGSAKKCKKCLKAWDDAYDGVWD